MAVDGQGGKFDVKNNDPRPIRREVAELIKGSRGLKILEIGSGEVMGVKPKSGDVYIGVDVIYNQNKEVFQNGNITVIKLKDEGFLPKDFEPDLIICVAPNPDDIDNGLFEKYGDWIEVTKKLVIVLENRTENTWRMGGIERVKEMVVSQLRNVGRRSLEVDEYSDDLLGELLSEWKMDRILGTDDSRDLGGTGILVYSER